MIQRIVHGLYVLLIRPLLRSDLQQQRVKLLWDGWGYYRFLGINTISITQRWWLLKRFLSIDWNVPHSHKPTEVCEVLRCVAERPARPGEVIVEAGCWQGGSSAKFSIIAKSLGYRLFIYDSFEGVEELADYEKERGYNFSGEYASPQTVLQNNLDRYGAADVCEIHPGWFCNTLAAQPITSPIRAVYIDCDTAKGSVEVLAGTLPTLVDDGWITTQDYHIPVVREFLSNSQTWLNFGRETPEFKHRCHNLAVARAPKQIASTDNAVGQSDPTAAISI